MPLYIPPHRKNSTGKRFNYKAKSDALYKTDEWVQFRARFLEANPECLCCGSKSNVCDHLEAHKGKIELFWKEGNYLPLCDRCHNTVTNKFDRDFKPRPVNEKITWIISNRNKNGLSPLVIKVVPLPKSVLKKSLNEELQEIMNSFRTDGT